MIYISLIILTVIVVAIIVIGCIGLGLLINSRPPTWYEDLPPKNWNSKELTQDEVTRAIEENERRWNASVDD